MIRGGGERGQVVVLVAMVLTALCMFGALVIDIGNARQTGVALQSAADAAATAGASQLPGSTANAEAYAADYAFDSLLVARSNTTITCPSDAPVPGTTVCYQSGGSGPIVYVTTPYTVSPAPANGTSPLAADEINVKICSTLATTLARVINIATTRPCKSSTADVTPAGLPCAICVLDSSGADALQLGPKSNAAISITGGSGIVDDSSDSDGLELGPKGSASITVASPGSIGAVGGDTIAPGATISPAVTTGISPGCGSTCESADAR